MKNMAVVLVSVSVFVLLVSLGNCTPLRTFSLQGSDDADRQEIMSLAARIIHVAMAGYSGQYQTEKRNSGTVDAMLNIPDFKKIGKR